LIESILTQERIDEPLQAEAHAARAYMLAVRSLDVEAFPEKLLVEVKRPHRNRAPFADIQPQLVLELEHFLRQSLAGGILTTEERVIRDLAIAGQAVFDHQVEREAHILLPTRQHVVARAHEHNLSDREIPEAL
jgi:hypothetical protein